ncbi:hypothetical protein uvFWCGRAMDCOMC440_056 [Freshwater phage uvFW-CGR-AMD-COM-C440]|nr:hypothetical protein uvFWCGRAMDCOMC440_056 [Freshwater phage uvFW-CGR-AMD-COM-C440]
MGLSQTPQALVPAEFSSGGITLLSTTTLSGASTIISGYSQSYQHLYLHIYGVTNATSNGTFRLLPNSTGIAQYTGFNTNNTNYNGSVTSLDLTLGTANERAVSNNAWSLTIFNYSSTAARKPILFSGLWVNQFLPSGAPQAGYGGGGFNTTSAITSLDFQHTGGNFSSGTVLLYGVK